MTTRVFVAPSGVRRGGFVARVDERKATRGGAIRARRTAILEHPVAIDDREGVFAARSRIRDGGVVPGVARGAT
jgi:hypothetical protein